MDQSSNNGGFNQFALGFVMGGIMGILYAPKSGKENRAALQELIKLWSEKAKEVAQPVLERAIEKAEPVLDEIQPIAQEKYAQAVQLIEPIAQNAVQETKEKIAEAVDPAIEQARQEIRAHIQKSRPKYFRGV